MMRVIRKSAKNAVLILCVVAVAVGVGAYVLAHQRLRFPWESTPFKLKATTRLTTKRPKP